MSRKEVLLRVELRLVRKWCQTSLAKCQGMAVGLMTAAYYLATILLIFEPHSRAATVTNILGLGGGVTFYDLAVNVGDTLVWTNQQLNSFGTNFVESYGGEWKSPPLLLGDSFAFTFTNAGRFVYRTGERSFPKAGVVTVRAWAGAPPALTMNAPVDGSRHSTEILLQATATNQEDVMTMDYFANSQLIDTATNAPFTLRWLPASGDYILTARATTVGGSVTWSDPVHVTVEFALEVWGASMLPTGEFLFHYVSHPTGGVINLYTSDSVLFTNRSLLTGVYSPGVYVDETVRGQGVLQRYYSVRWY